MRGHVQSSRPKSSVRYQFIRFVRECQIGCKSPKQSNGDKQAHVGGEESSRLHQLHDEAESETANQVDGECTKRKSVAVVAVDKPGSKIAGNGSNKPTRPDNENLQRKSI